MATYLITGVNRGLGFEFTRQLSADPANTIVGFVRDKAAAAKTYAEELPDRKNIHLVQAELGDYTSLKKGVEETATITGGAVDYVIGNAGIMSALKFTAPLSDLGQRPEELEQELTELFQCNVIGYVHLYNLVMPLVLKGRVKKVIHLGSGHAVNDLIRKYNLFEVAPYAIVKQAGNTMIAKFSAEYAEKGVLFLSVSPGVVNTQEHPNATPKDWERLAEMSKKFMAYKPDWTGPTTADVAVKQVLSVAEKASVEAGDGGAAVSQFGNDQWL